MTLPARAGVEPSPPLEPPPSVSARITDYLALERNVVAVAAAMFVMGLGEELWKRFIPKYLEALGAPVLAIGLYGTARDFLDGIYQYPGGWLADRLGRRRALTIFVVLATLGYALYAVATSWAIVFVGLLFVMGWASMASPTLFAVVGDALPKGRRAMGFTVQSILRRVPIVVAPTIGGALIAAYGTAAGVRIGLVVTIGLALVALLVIRRVNVALPPMPHAPESVLGVWRSLPQTLRRLLLSDVFIRTSESLVDVFLILYATNVVGISAAQFGILVAVLMLTSIIVYIPAARLADRIGRKPFVVATFVAFSAFPVAVVLSPSFEWLVVAFIVGGLREIGEPARKALIVDLAVPHLRARSVGLYYLIRSLAITPAALVGGLLWGRSPVLPFIVSGIVGVVGTLVFIVSVSEGEAA